MKYLINLEALKFPESYTGDDDGKVELIIALLDEYFSSQEVRKETGSYDVRKD